VFAVDDADVVEALVADAREWVGLAGDHDGLEAGGAEALPG